MLGERVGGACEVGSRMISDSPGSHEIHSESDFLTPSQGFLQGVLVTSNRKPNQKRLMPKEGLLAENSDARAYFRIVLMQVFKPCPLYLGV